MNFNDDPEKLKREEQTVLDALISKMDHVLRSLDVKMQEYVAEAKDANISINPDLYLSQLLAQKGIRDTAENRKKLLQARDELYHTRLLLHYEHGNEKGIEELKVGLHSCMHNAEQYVISWTMPLCRHYILDNASVEFESIVKGKFGETYHTNYTLLVKNQVKLRFTRVAKAMNLYPGIFDDKTLEMIKGTGFLSEAYLDEMIRQFNPDEFDPDSAAKIISDEFLQELLERRSTPEFKNIVFSIQKKQGEIIQAPYKRHMIVQGCAGSGKSMIMLHRLPILLYDNPTSLMRTNLYIITPSQMYIQLAENMRHQLEISDINMGTLEQYYDLCISRYPGHRAGEYGRISYTSKITQENEKYVYSSACIKDIEAFFERLIAETDIALDKAYEVLSLQENKRRPANTYAQIIGSRSLYIQDVVNANNVVLGKYFRGISDAIDTLRELNGVLKHRKDEVMRSIAKDVSEYTEEIAKAQREIEKLDPKDNAIAIQNRKATIDAGRERLLELAEENNAVNADEEYFGILISFSSRIVAALEPFSDLKMEFSQNTAKRVYDAINAIGQLIGSFFVMSWELSKTEDKYFYRIEPIRKSLEKADKSISALQMIKDRYLELDYYSDIRRVRDALSHASSDGVMNAYESVMGKIGVKRTESGQMHALKCSPYIYLQVLYIFQGRSSGAKESLLAIDEAQGIAPEELRLLKNVNGNSVTFNIYGDIYQHIEGTKGIESWDEYKDVIDYDIYEMQENYRNASQITEYCNRKFGMQMNAINTPGKGVHEMQTEAEFRTEMITQLMDTQRAGLAAILVANDVEARYLLGEFSAYEQKFHDMTGEDFSIHRTRWNIIHIDDAKGLEFSSVIVLSGRMSRNQQYIAYTRALDDLYVYTHIIDVSEYEKRPQQKKNDTDDNEQKTGDNSSKTMDTPKDGTEPAEHAVKAEVKSHVSSEVRTFFESKGLEVIDRRDEGGRLWVIGEKASIRNIINEAIAKFKISGKYASGKESMNKPGWCTKTDK